MMSLFGVAKQGGEVLPPPVQSIFTPFNTGERLGCSTAISVEFQTSACRHWISYNVVEMPRP